MTAALSRTAAACAVFATIFLLSSLWRPALRFDEARERRQEAADALYSGDGRKALELIGSLRQTYPNNAHYVEMEANAHRLLDEWEAEAASWELYLHLAPRLKTACPRLIVVYEKLEQPAAVQRARRLCAQIGSGP